MLFYVKYHGAIMTNYRLTHFKGFKLDQHTKIYNLF